MSTTLPFLVLALLALLPGALFVYTIEALLQRYGGDVADRTMRFIAASAVLWLPFFWVLYMLYTHIWHVQRSVAGRVVYVNRFTTNDLPQWFYWVIAGYVAVPILLGAFVAFLIRNSTKAQDIVIGKPLSRSAWQTLFKYGGGGNNTGTGRALVVRAQLNDEDATVVAGYFGPQSVTPAGESEGDVWLEAQVRLDDQGQLRLDGQENPVYEPGIYLRRENVLWLEAYEVMDQEGQ
ncbi:DUF6338 family protein [Streptomyces sp. NPDC005017]|uniref:DUF6338 family protein n=1 Tax=Streptomyces sp. NPDC005017 TaxID=3364706 RepID=UPI003688597A